MKTKTHPRFLILILALLGLSNLNSALSTAQAQGTAFTYQGQLSSNGVPANGFYDFEFTLYPNSAGGGSPIGSTIPVAAIGVTNGLFTTGLDFGSVFAGNPTWLAISVRSNGIGGYTPLSPPQPLTPAPYSIYAANAASAVTADSANSVLATNIVGALSLAQLPTSVMTNNETSTALSIGTQVLSTNGMPSGVGASWGLYPTFSAEYCSTNAFWRSLFVTNFDPSMQLLGYAYDAPHNWHLFAFNQQTLCDISNDSHWLGRTYPLTIVQSNVPPSRWPNGCGITVWNGSIYWIRSAGLNPGWIYATNVEWCSYSSATLTSNAPDIQLVLPNGATNLPIQGAFDGSGTIYLIYQCFAPTNGLWAGNCIAQFSTNGTWLRTLTLDRPIYDGQGIAFNPNDNNLYVVGQDGWPGAIDIFQVTTNGRVSEIQRSFAPAASYGFFPNTISFPSNNWTAAIGEQIYTSGAGSWSNSVWLFDLSGSHPALSVDAEGSVVVWTDLDFTNAMNFSTDGSYGLNFNSPDGYSWNFANPDGTLTLQGKWGGGDASYIGSSTGNITFVGNNLLGINDLAASSFSGNGSGLTDLPASNLTGTVPLAQLPGALLTNNEAAATTISNYLTLGGPGPFLTLNSSSPAGGLFRFQTANADTFHIGANTNWMVFYSDWPTLNTFAICISNSGVLNAPNLVSGSLSMNTNVNPLPMNAGAAWLTQLTISNCYAEPPFLLVANGTESLTSGSAAYTLSPGGETNTTGAVTNYLRDSIGNNVWMDQAGH
ncbi:MAG: hypothetical protein ABSA47_10195, partial [Verrucomicrobiota bacterium]